MTDNVGTFLSYLIGTLVFGSYLAIGYLLVFNRATRQSLHDLVVGTYVVRQNTEKQPVGEVWKGHFVVVALLVLSAASLSFFTRDLFQSGPFKGMDVVQERLSDETLVSHATITVGFSTFKQLGAETNQNRFVTAQIYLNDNRTQDEALARQLAAIVVEHYPQAQDKDVMLVTLSHGYSIGIWSQWSSKTYQIEPGEVLGGS
ncbi:hypothetical protein GCM10007392_33120 [Saccharospirillum salsuginis]|uniref:RDD family protein n=2 Tax=Saccharospirillum salsuginis TaxID=418750 RepID=A0A918KI59_9GAMM|nr:hypothetical protein GCM10007392_33120 [Saccharospirillum salsuginis]